MPFTYLLRCADGSYYVGSTRSLEKRLWEHQEGLGAEYTRRRRPVTLAWSAEFPNVGEAFFWEKRIQGWSRRKREALIRGDWEALPDLARKTFAARVTRSAPRRPRPKDPLTRLAAMTRPPEVVRITDAFLERIESSSAGLVRGLYLHGSLCWGEFFSDSDIDFVGVLSRPATPDDLAALDAAHALLRERFPTRRYEGFYCQVRALARPPSALGPVPVHFGGTFSAEGSSDVNLVTWQELAERGHVVRGPVPTVHTDLPALLDFTRQNLDTYWRPLHQQLIDAGPSRIGSDVGTVVWTTLGVARLHHLLAREHLTSKSGAGRYIVDELDPRWHRLAHCALDIRERPGSPSQYDDPADRGRDVIAFVGWAIADGCRLR